jgi:hypothetical protein
MLFRGLDHVPDDKQVIFKINLPEEKTSTKT